jgi:import inner membrane translocase subunit TIM50
MGKIVLLDTKASHAKAQPENAIIIPPWNGDPNDRELIKLVPFLEYLAVFGIDDVRPALKSFAGKNVAEEFAIREAKMRAELAKRSSANASTKKGLGKLANSLSGRTSGGPVSLGGELPEGKTVFDVIREEGMKRYKHMEEEIKANGEKWIADEAEQLKQMEAEQMNEMKKGFFSWVPGLGGSSSPSSGEAKPGSA